MKTIRAIIKRDLKRLVSNPVSIVVALGICVIPSLYAWFNIAANWDPYSNTSSISMAVANCDEGVDQQLLGPTNVGDMLIDELEGNGDLDWHFVSKEDALEGVHSGEFYGAIIIPSDFSYQMTSFLDGELGSPLIEYYRNEKISAVANKVTDTAASTIEEQVNEHFIAKAMDVVITKIQGVGADIDAIVLGSSQAISSGVLSAAKTVEATQTAVKSVNTTIDEMYPVIKNTQASLGSLQEVLPLMSSSLEESRVLMGDVRVTVQTASGSLASALGQGMQLLGDASGKANAALGGLSGDIQGALGNVDAALELAGNINAINNSLIKRLDVLIALFPDKADELNDLKQKLITSNGINADIIGNLRETSTNMGVTVGAIENAGDSINGAVQTGIETIGNAHTQFQTEALPQFENGLDSFSAAAGNLSGVCTMAGPVVTQAKNVLVQLETSLKQTQDVLNQVDSLLGEALNSLDAAAVDIAAVKSSELLNGVSAFLDIDADHVAQIVASPVTVETKVLFGVENYGSGVAPFYTNLALWVGGFVLVAILKAEVDLEDLPQGVAQNMNATQAYLGRWLLFVLLGIVQGFIASAGDLIMGIQCVEPVAFVAGSMAISAVYVSIIYALAISFKHIGKGLAVLLVILQIPGSSGMYPIELMPSFFQALNPILPFTYGINLMRECIAGFYGMNYTSNLGSLALFMAASFVLGLLLRPHLINLNSLFDEKLLETHVMLAEKDWMRGPQSRAERMASVMAQTEESRVLIERRGVWMEEHYRQLIRTGLILVACVAFMFFILMATVADKLIMLAIWIGLVVAVDAYFIVIEYVLAKYRNMKEEDEQDA